MDSSTRAIWEKLRLQDGAVRFEALNAKKYAALWRLG
jgi:hypothetical protein